MHDRSRYLLGAGIALIATIGWTGKAVAQQQMSVYGYFSTRLEKVYNEPGLNGTQVVKESPPREFSHPFFNVMFQHQMADRFKAYVNLNGSGAGEIDVRNVWGEYSASQYANFRFGKIYRRFGLYNEILDAVPSYYGIEPPEAFDQDHLLITRTTTLMFYGSAPLGTATFNYSLSTDNGESGGLDGEGTLPVGFDGNVRFGRGRFVVGVSGYTTGGRTAPDRGVGEGSPRSGVLPWMESDDFQIVNAYGEARVKNLTIQFEWAKANHDAVRDPASVVTLLQGTSVNANQLSRMLINPAGDPTDPANVRLQADYDVETWYFRIGYSFYTKAGEFGPYFQWDWYSNPETIASKRWGGDNEAGVADDGIFNKGTIGILYRPIPQVAVKLDGSAHYYDFAGQSVSFPELRFDVSYMFGL